VTVYLMEELGDARMRCDQLVRYIDEAHKLIENSGQKDGLFEVGGHLIHAIPDTLFRLQKALQAVALAAGRLDYEELKQELKPEKVRQLENVLQDVRIRHVQHRSGPWTPEQVAAKLQALASQTEKEGSVSPAGLLDIILGLETGQKVAADAETPATLNQLAEALRGTDEPSRHLLAAVLRRMLGDAQVDMVKETTMPANPWKLSADDDKESKFEEGKPADPTKNMSPEDKAEWNKQKDEHKDEFKKEAVSSMAEGEWYKQTFRTDEDVLYYTPISQQKNGGWKGLMVTHYEGGRPQKAKQLSVGKFEFRLWTKVPESDVPSNVMTKFKDRMAFTQLEEIEEGAFTAAAQSEGEVRLALEAIGRTASRAKTALDITHTIIARATEEAIPSTWKAAEKSLKASLDSITTDAEKAQKKADGNVASVLAAIATKAKKAKHVLENWGRKMVRGNDMQQLGSEEEVRKKFKAENPDITDAEMDKIVAQWKSKKEASWKVDAATDVTSDAKTIQSFKRMITTMEQQLKEMKHSLNVYEKNPEKNAPQAENFASAVRTVSTVGRIVFRSVYGPSYKMGSAEGELLSLTAADGVDVSKAKRWLKDMKSVIGEAESALGKYEKDPGKMAPQLTNAQTDVNSLFSLLRRINRAVGGPDRLSKQAADDEKESMFEEGKPADPTKNMSPEDAKKWKEENDKNKDKFKSAARFVPIEEAQKGDMVEIEAGRPKEKVTGKVVRVKKDGVVTVDVEKSRSNPGGHSNEDIGYVDVRLPKTAAADWKVASKVAGQGADDVLKFLEVNKRLKRLNKGKVDSSWIKEALDILNSYAFYAAVMSNRKKSQGRWFMNLVAPLETRLKEASRSLEAITGDMKTLDKVIEKSLLAIGDALSDEAKNSGEWDDYQRARTATDWKAPTEG